MELEYKRDLHHNYMIIREMVANREESFCIKMLANHSVEGILSLEKRIIDNQIYFYYDITARQALSVLLDKATLSFERLKNMISRILRIIEISYEYLLEEDDFILTPEHTYLDVTNDLVSLCYYPGYQKNILLQFGGFLEYLMNKVDYSDQKAVLLVYNLYAASKEEGFVMQHLTAILQKACLNQFDNKSDPLVEDHKNQRVSEDLSVHDIMVSKKDYSEDENKADNNNININNINKNYNKKNNKNNAFNEVSNKNTPTQTERKNKITSNISVMMEKLSSEKEIPCYPIQTYLLTGACLAGGILLIILGLSAKVVYNSLKSQIEVSKLLILLLIILSLEGYLLKKIWDKKNRISKIVSKNEYINPLSKKEETRNESLFHKLIGKQESMRTSRKEMDDTNCESEIQAPSKSNPSFIIDKSVMNKEELYQSEPLIQNTKEDREFMDIIEDDSDYNPTCLLSESIVLPNYFLRPVDNIHFEPIPINTFPFLIGKLKNNVSYCLSNDMISRYHAKISKEQESFYITDLNSTNGTFLNKEELVTYQKKELKPGDEVSFANIQFHFVKEN